MDGVRGQHRRALRHGKLTWDAQVRDPRRPQGVRHAHLGMLGLVVAALAVGKKGLRQAAELGRDVGARTRRALGLPAVIAGTTLWRLLEKQSVEGLRESLQAQVTLLLEALDTPRIHMPMGVMSVDGKSLMTTHDEGVEGLDAVDNDGTGNALWRLGALRAALTHLVAAPCVDLEFIGAKNGESTAFRVLFPRLVASYGEYFGVVTGDAGLTAAENAALIIEYGKHYCLGLKGNQPKLYEYAQEAIAQKDCAPRAKTVDREHGHVVVRELWTHSLKPGEVSFPGARFLLLVRQTHLDKDGAPLKDKDGKDKEPEYRYFVTSLDTTLFSFQQLLALVRLHWGIENRLNWTLDVVLGEDSRQPCRASRTALEVVAWLRAMAFNLISSWRARLPKEHNLPVQWARACELLRDAYVHGRRGLSTPTSA